MWLFRVSLISFFFFFNDTATQRSLPAINQAHQSLSGPRWHILKMAYFTQKKKSKLFYCFIIFFKPLLSLR